MTPPAWTPETLAAFCAVNGYPAGRLLPDGRYLVLGPLVLGRWRLMVGRDATGYDEGY